ncbi:MAG: hypothetical protein H6737_28880 [Alphaproteobacteria bacterium]|nr:hypothetical protein [Alphaproteobacteria bacterium]
MRSLSLVAAALCGVAVGAFLGADLHVDMTVPERVFVVADGRRLESGAHSLKRRLDFHRDFGGVSYVGKDRFYVDRYGLRAAIGAPDSFFVAPMGVWDPQGHRLSGVREGSLAWELGFRNDDLVRPMARDAEETVQRPLEFVLRGEPIRVAYEVR